MIENIDLHQYGLVGAVLTFLYYMYRDLMKRQSQKEKLQRETELEKEKIRSEAIEFSSKTSFDSFERLSKHIEVLCSKFDKLSDDITELLAQDRQTRVKEEEMRTETKEMYIRQRKVLDKVEKTITENVNSMKETLKDVENAVTMCQNVCSNNMKIKKFEKMAT